jgi:hypothetical protein
VQIKRPDPHPPEHHGEPGGENPQRAEPEEEEVQLVSEAAACPYCTQTEFGVTYEPPPFRRGLVYNGQGQAPLGAATSAMSSSSSLNSPNAAVSGRRRATSLAVTDKTVITTDMVRPDWAKKLADAKSHALRRAAAATALHNAAYMVGNLPQESRFGLGRRRRIFTSDSAGSSGHGTPRREGESSSGQPGGSSDLFSSRLGSRRGNRLDDLEDLMMMEAIRLSLAAEEERKKKEDKDAAKEAKKEGKKKAKEIKKVVKEQKRIGSGFHPIEIDGVDEAESSAAAGKGKGIDRSGAGGFNPMTEPTSTLNASSSKEDPQKHLEVSRAQIQREKSDSGNSAAFDPEDSEQTPHRSALRNFSNASSSASSFAESYQSLPQHSQNNLNPGSSQGPSPNASGMSLSQGGETPPQDTTSTEPMFNFESMKDAITPEEENKNEIGPQYIEDVGEMGADPKANGKAPESSASDPLTESTMTLKPYESVSIPTSPADEDDVTPAPPVKPIMDDHAHLDHKHIGEVSMMQQRLNHQATQ